MVKKILIIQEFIRKTLKMYNKLPCISYNRTMLNYYSINSFNVSRKNENYINNKERENVIGAVINGKIPDMYYKYSNRWKSMRENILDYIQVIFSQKNETKNSIDKIVCIHKGGRKNYYDFKIMINDNLEYNIEFKFNILNIQDAPQFISPMKPSQYLSNSYEEYYYDNFLKDLSKKYNIKLTDKDEYLKKIHSCKPDCMKEYQEKYYSGCRSSSKFSGEKNDVLFYKDLKKKSKESIEKFIEKNDLNIDKLSEYLQKSQKDKYFMLYKNGTFHLYRSDINDYKLISYHKDPKKSSYIVMSENHKKIKVLLRWKNGNGISYPSFQISS